MVALSRGREGVQVKYPESQLLELKDSVPESDFFIEPTAGYLGFEVKPGSVNVAAFLEIFRNKRQGQLSVDEGLARPLAQLEQKRALRIRKSLIFLHTAKDVYNGYVRDDA